MTTRYMYGYGSFRYLLENGTYYTNAHYQYANTETIVGHTTLATGTFPSQHGMIGNVWFDREAGELVYNDDKIASAKLDRNTVKHAVAAALTDFDGIALAVASHRLSTQPAGPLVDKVRNNHHIARSGDIYIIQEPYWFLFDYGPVKAVHGSPWRYDTHVPIIFSGPGTTAQTVHRRVHPADVAPTIAAVLGMTPPGSAQGSLLMEVLE